MKRLFGEPSAQYTPEQVKFGGVPGMLDVAGRVKPVGDIDIGRMLWAGEVLDESQRFNKALRDIAVRADLYPKDSWGPAMLRGIEREAVIDAVLLSMYWHKPVDASPREQIGLEIKFLQRRAQWEHCRQRMHPVVVYFNKPQFQAFQGRQLR
jgi:hypothetical protein